MALDEDSTTLAQNNIAHLLFGFLRGGRCSGGAFLRRLHDQGALAHRLPALRLQRGRDAPGCRSGPASRLGRGGEELEAGAGSGTVRLVWGRKRLQCLSKAVLAGIGIIADTIDQHQAETSLI